MIRRKATVWRQIFFESLQQMLHISMLPRTFEGAIFFPEGFEKNLFWQFRALLAILGNFTVFTNRFIKWARPIQI